MNLKTLAALLVFATDAFCQGFPYPGNYAGTLTVTKTLPVERLSSRYSLRAQANVADDGTITILTTVPESPAAAANVESTVTRVMRTITEVGPPGTKGPYGDPGPWGPAFAIQLLYSYSIDGKPVDVSFKDSLLRITYRNPPLPEATNDVAAPPSNFVSFEFLLRKLPNASRAGSAGTLRTGR